MLLQKPELKDEGRISIFNNKSAAMAFPPPSTRSRTGKLYAASKRLMAKMKANMDVMRPTFKKTSLTTMYSIRMPAHPVLGRSHRMSSKNRERASRDKQYQ